MDVSKEPGIVVAQVFIEKLVFSHREDFLNLPANTPPVVGEVSIGLMVGESKDGESGITRIEVKTDPAKKPTYNVELIMVALVKRVPGEGNMTIQEFLKSGASVSLLYPFLREAFANVTLRGRFGPVWLNTINPQAIAQELQALAPSEAVAAAGSSRPPVESAGPEAARSTKRKRAP